LKVDFIKIAVERTEKITILIDQKTTPTVASFLLKNRKYFL